MPRDNLMPINRSVPHRKRIRACYARIHFCWLVGTLATMALTLAGATGSVPTSTGQAHRTNEIRDVHAVAHTESTYRILPDESLPGFEPKPLACGPAALAVALQLLGEKVVNEELVGLANENQQSNFTTLTAYLRGKGLHVKAVKLGPEHLASLNNVAILHTLGPKIVNGKEEEHFVVFAGGIDEETVYAFDPVADYGLNGPARLDKLAEKMSGKALIVSKYPIDLSPLLTHTSVRSVSERWSWPHAFTVIGFAMILFALAITAKHKWARPNNRSASGLLIFALLASGTPWVAAKPVETKPAMSSQMGMLGDKIGTIKSAAIPGSSPYVPGGLLHEFGAVQKGTMLHHEFEILNPESHPIKLRLGKKSCGCLAPRIIGASMIPPGGQSRVGLDMYAKHGGGMRHGVLLHVSSQKDTILLEVKATVKNDTIISPQIIDFGEVPITAEIQHRPVRIVHYSETEKSFRMERMRIPTRFLKVASLPDPSPSTNDSFDTHGRVSCNPVGETKLPVKSF